MRSGGSSGPAANATSRAAPRRTHRTLGVYLVMHAWVAKLDCVIIDGEALRFYLGDLSRLEKSRQQHIIDDTKALFPFAHYLRDCSGRTATLFLSRLPMPETVWKTSGRLAEFKERLIAAGVRAGYVELPKEEEIVALNAKVIHGIEEFVPLTPVSDD